MKVKIKQSIDSRKGWVIELLKKQDKDGYLIASKQGHLYHIGSYVLGSDWIEEVED